MDNYDAQFRHSKASLDRAQHANINWTGVAVRQYMGQDFIDDSLVHDADGAIVPVMPDDLLAPDNVQAIFQFIVEHTQLTATQAHALNRFPIEGMRTFKPLYATSLLKTWEPDRVPLKPNINNPNVPEEFKDAIRRSPDTLANFYPKAIVNENPASQEGLINLLKEYFTKNVTSAGRGLPQRYFNLTCDENLYKRLMRVRYYCLRTLTCTHRVIFCFELLQICAMLHSFPKNNAF